MNIKLISELSVLGFAMAFKAIDIGAKYKFEKVKALEMAIAENSPDDISRYEKAKHDLVLCNKVTKREKKALSDAVVDYKKKTGFDSKKTGFYKNAERAVEEFKASLGYDDKLRKIEQDMEDSIAAFKVSVNYDSTIEALDKDISDATEKWEAQEKLFSSADEGISEMALKLKHAAEDAKNETIKKAKEQKAALEKQLNAEVEKFEKKKRDAIRSMEEKIAKERRRLDEKTTKSVNDLEQDLDKAKEKMKTDIHNQRTPEETDSIVMAKENEEIVRIQDANNASRALEIADETSSAEQLAWWLKDHKWSKGGVIFVGSLPLIPAGYLLYRYGKFILDIAKFM